MEITLLTVDPMRLAVLESRGPNIEFRKVWGELRPTVQAQGLVRPGARFASLFQLAELATPVVMEWYAAGLLLAEGQAMASPLTERRIERGTFATWTYQGSYEGLGAAWGKFMAGFQAAGHPFDPTRAGFEIYLDETMEALPAEPRTALYLPTKTAG